MNPFLSLLIGYCALCWFIVGFTVCVDPATAKTPLWKDLLSILAAPVLLPMAIISFYREERRD